MAHFLNVVSHQFLHLFNGATLFVVARIVICLFALLMTGSIRSAIAAPPSGVPPGYSSELIDVKFREGTNVDPPEDALPPDLRNAVASIRRGFSLSEEQLNAIRMRGESLSNGRLPNLTLWFQITLKPGTDATAFIEDLKALDSVERVEFVPLPPPPPAITPNFEGMQGYLDAAPGGIDARFSWTIPGGNGTGVKLYDIEYSWNQTHEDLSKANGIPLLLDPGDSADDPFSDNNHGTAVLGEIIADNDTKGVTGISWGADIGLAPANTVNRGYDPGNAILLAVADGAPGDVILIEQQVAVCNLPAPCNGPGGNCGPLEWVEKVFDAIQTAVANRFVVVEAAGNGGVNLDQTACDNRFNRAMRDSGAIIVGAGGQPGSGSDRERLTFSSFGSRVDLQGWGQGVVTTGYGTAPPNGYRNSDAPNDPNFWYRFTFNGTSSASPIVAGAVANLQGIALTLFETPLLAFQVRQLLVATGSPQLGNTAENIGPRPDLREAITRITTGAVDIYFLVDLSGSFSDDLPIFKAQAPAIISALRASNPDTRFGLGKYEDYPISPFGDAGSGDKAYERLVDLTFDTDLVLETINGLFTRSGGDSPQSQLPALFQAATGAGQDLSASGFPGASIPAGQQVNFRDGATKLFLLWTDASFHQQGDVGAIPYPGPSFSETVNAILALDPPQVIGISSGGGGLADLQAIAAATGAFAPSGGVDCDGDGIIDLLEGDPLVCTIAFSGEGIGQAILSLIEAAVVIPPIPTVGADVSIHVTGSPNVLAVGAELTYRLRVRNLGPSDATGVIITDTLPANVNFVSASSGCSRSDRTVTCKIGNMRDGESAVRLIRVRPTAPGKITNSATVRANETDPKPANNAVKTLTTVR
jgi:serine protease